MSSQTVNQAYQKVDHISSEIMGHSFDQKSASTLKNFICISTDKKSLESSKNLLFALTKLKESLYGLKGTDYELLKDIFKDINADLLKINEMFEFVKSIFDLGDSEGAEVSIDDEVMYDFLSNMEKNKVAMQDISDMLQLVLKIQKVNTGESKLYTCEELIDCLTENNN